MPLNQIKTYPQLLDLGQFNEKQRNESLKGIFRRDIENNQNFKFQTKPIRPIKKEGHVSMEILFHHLTTREDRDEKEKKTGTRSFEMARSQRLHWIKYHVDGMRTQNIDIFSYEDRLEGRGDVIRTYIYDMDQEYVIILEPQRSNIDYFLITAYFLNEPGGKKQIVKKQKKKMNELY
jgi:hypothetical protein